MRDHRRGYDFIEAALHPELPFGVDRVLPFAATGPPRATKQHRTCAAKNEMSQY